jgi:hypothetical protein
VGEDRERERYQAAWADARGTERSQLVSCGVVTFLPPLVVTLLICRGFSEGADPPFGMCIPLVVIALVLLFSVPLGLLASFVVGGVGGFRLHCARCGARFNKLLLAGPRCHHCGLRFGAMPDPDGEKPTE